MRIQLSRCSGDDQESREISPQHNKVLRVNHLPAADPYELCKTRNHGVADADADEDDDGGYVYVDGIGMMVLVLVMMPIWNETCSTCFCV